MELIDNFKVGDRVFQISYGWGEVLEVSKEKGKEFVRVYFDFLKDSVSFMGEEFFSLSFVEYGLKNHLDYERFIGKWGKFFNDKNEVFIGRLERIIEADEYPFIFMDICMFRNFEPLTEEQIKVLGLEE